MIISVRMIFDTGLRYLLVRRFCVVIKYLSAGVERITAKRLIDGV